MTIKTISDNSMATPTDPSFLTWLSMMASGMLVLLFGWTHKRASSAHIEVAKERIANEARINLCYEKIAETVNRTEACRIKIEKDIAEHMTEVQIKDFVDRSIKPIQTQISGVDNRIDVVHDDVKTILKEVRK